MSSETTNWEAVARYLAGESPAEEQAVVRQWLAEHPADARVIAALDDVLGRVTAGPDAEKGIDVEAALARVKSRRDQPDLTVIRGDVARTATVTTPVRRNRWAAVAATAAAAAAVILIASRVVPISDSSTSSPASVIAARTLSTPAGGRDSLVLPDGSKVMLGPGSVLTTAEGFGQSERRVTITGEALFTVVHDDAKPFIVTANGVSIRDIGTAFVVRSDPGRVRVAVTEGVVEVTPSTGSPTRLDAGDVASVSPTGAVRAERGVGAADELAWTTGRLVFRDTPLSEVAEDLRRWYGVTLDIPEAALRRRPYTGSFQGDSLGSVLEAISVAVGATTQRRPDDVIVVRSLPR